MIQNQTSLTFRGNQKKENHIVRNSALVGGVAYGAYTANYWINTLIKEPKILKTLINKPDDEFVKAVHDEKNLKNFKKGIKGIEFITNIGNKFLNSNFVKKNMDSNDVNLAKEALNDFNSFSNSKEGIKTFAKSFLNNVESIDIKTHIAKKTAWTVAVGALGGALVGIIIKAFIPEHKEKHHNNKSIDFSD